MLRTLIVDDEPLAREGLRQFLEAEDGVEIVGECRNGREAVTRIERDRPDVVLLDVQMPDLDGFGVLAELEGPLPVVVFVTAYDEYALQAFQAHAVDYLLKPVERHRFRRALDRARAQIAYDRGRELTGRLAELLADVRGRERYPKRFAVRMGGRVTFVRVEEIDWIEAAGNYARLHVGTERHVIRETMTRLEEQLDPGQFARIHRSTIVNIDAIKEIQPWFKGEHVVILRNGKQLALSRTFRDRLL